MIAHRRLVGGTVGLGLAIAAAVGISGRNGPLDDPADAIRVPGPEARVDRAPSESATGWINMPEDAAEGLVELLSRLRKCWPALSNDEHARTFAPAIRLWNR